MILKYCTIICTHTHIVLNIKVEKFLTENVAYSHRYDYDVALIRIKGEIPIHDGKDNVTPICLPPIGAYNTTFSGQHSVVAGWGLPYYDSGSTARILQKLELPVIDTAECSKMLPATVTVTPR